uniref:hypothetical protein n=1 Tax=Pseudomonas chlororaphis TaxID=587753 RepID=UPI0021557220|nr:hypothetical protein [Pseudomonas chlororaphis]
MDEFALFTPASCWMPIHGEYCGLAKTAARPFFEKLGAEGCARIEAVTMGMNTAFDLEVRQHFPATFGRTAQKSLYGGEGRLLPPQKPAEAGSFISKISKVFINKTEKAMKQPYQKRCTTH